MNIVNYGKHYVDKKDIKSVIRVLKSNYLTQGPLISKFEKQLKKKIGSKFCTVVSNGSAALHLLAISLGWKKGDIILTTPLSFVATSNCIFHTGAKPFFVDIDKNTGNICPIKLEQAIKKISKRNRIKAIIAIDYGGHPCEWPLLYKIAKKNKIILINDCCHAIGSSINNNKNYAIKYADFVTFSFHPVKTITTGEGGAVLTNNKKIDEKIKTLRTHGIEKKRGSNMWSYNMKMLGFNYRLTDIQCALGISQLEKLEKFVKKRAAIASIYNKSFKDFKNIELFYPKKYIKLLSLVSD